MNKPETVIQLHFARDFKVETQSVKYKEIKARIFDQCKMGNNHLIFYFLFFHNSFKPKRCVYILYSCCFNQFLACKQSNSISREKLLSFSARELMSMETEVNEINSFRA